MPQKTASDVNLYYQIVSRPFYEQKSWKFSPAAGIYWLIKLPVLPLRSPKFKMPRKTASDVNLYYQIVSRPFYEQKSWKFSPAAGIYWLIKLPVLPLRSPKFKMPRKTASDVNLYYQIVSRPFYEQKSWKFSPAAGIYWLIKLPVLPLRSPKFKMPRKTASDVNLYYQIVSRPFYEQKSWKFSPAAGIYWLIKLPVLPLRSPKFKMPRKTASDVNLYYQIVSRPFYEQKSWKFSPAAGISGS